MRRIFSALALSLTVLLCSGAAVGQGEPDEDLRLWLGAHYTDLQDYTKKVGEYNLGNSEWLPDFRVNYFRQATDYLLTLDGQYFDNKNISGKVTGSLSDRLTGQIEYRSLIRQQGQDLLGNLETREWFGASAGGKILTHEITDPDADYNYNRNEILTKVSVLLSRKNNIRLHTAHRSILKSGEEQKISSTHCFSCHVTSQTADVKPRRASTMWGTYSATGCSNPLPMTRPSTMTRLPIRSAAAAGICLLRV